MAVGGDGPVEGHDDGTTPDTPFEEVTGDWCCSVCRACKRNFESCEE